MVFFKFTKQKTDLNLSCHTNAAGNILESIPAGSVPLLANISTRYHQQSATLSAQSAHSSVEQILFACFVIYIFLFLMAVCATGFLGNKLYYNVNDVIKHNEYCTVFTVLLSLY